MLGNLAQTPPSLLPQRLPAAYTTPTEYVPNLNTRRWSAIANVLVFTPYAIYLARGVRPPGWLIAASLAYLGISFFDDVRYLVQERGEINSLSGCGCNGVVTPAPPMQFRVNR